MLQDSIMFFWLVRDSWPLCKFISTLKDVCIVIDLEDISLYYHFNKFSNNIFCC
ncbi:hypothetical protein Hanom_Chr10g00890051 [Helianthus anomalus]